MTSLPPHLQPYTNQWDEHWAMRKWALAEKLPGFTPKCLTKTARLRADNALLRLSKKRYDIGLMLNKATENYWRSFYEWPDCIKSRPLLETVTLGMLHRSNPERAGEVLKRVVVKRIGEQPVESKAEMMARLAKYL